MKPQALEARLQSLEARLEEIGHAIRADGDQLEQGIEVIEAQAAHTDLEQQMIHLARDLRMLTMALISLSRLLEVTKVAPADAGASVYDARN